MRRVARCLCAGLCVIQGLFTLMANGLANVLFRSQCAVS
ncbi:hypothetical protein P3T23_003791 [Paraburkholderia sp. GAS448]